MSVVSLVVVDRQIEVELLIHTAELNHARGVDGQLLIEQPFLLYSPQVFGSDKTTFGTNVTSLLRDVVVVDRILHPLLAPNDTLPEDLVALRRDQTFNQCVGEVSFECREGYYLL
jgi:hypothetical protein